MVALLMYTLLVIVVGLCIFGSMLGITMVHVMVTENDPFFVIAVFILSIMSFLVAWAIYKLYIKIGICNRNNPIIAKVNAFWKMKVIKTAVNILLIFTTGWLTLGTIVMIDSEAGRGFYESIAYILIAAVPAAWFFWLCWFRFWHMRPITKGEVTAEGDMCSNKNVFPKTMAACVVVLVIIMAIFLLS